MATLARVFWDIDLRNSFDGLAEELKRQKARHSDLSCFMFVNAAKTHVKVFVGLETIIQFRKSSGTLTIDDLAALPSICQRAELSEKAVEALSAKLMKVSKRKAV